MPRPVLAAYLDQIARIHATGAGTGEISYYGALAGALNAIGETLKPRVFCVPNLRDRGAGFPDMGPFPMARARAPMDWPEGQAPERGVIEIDDIPADIAIKRDSKQVARYLAEYHLVLVTNYVISCCWARTRADMWPCPHPRRIHPRRDTLSQPREKTRMHGRSLFSGWPLAGPVRDPLP